ncbi:MAG: hypothetical protein ACRYHQ_33920 [Janthinobacterium lividum]
MLRFLFNPAVPSTNNLPERDGQRMKLRQKIFDGFRTVDAAAEFGISRSLLSIAEKRG